jgi:hypothetical protein
MTPKVLKSDIGGRNFADDTPVMLRSANDVA